jgi:hypothetical protein
MILQNNGSEDEAKDIYSGGCDCALRLKLPRVTLSSAANSKHIFTRFAGRLWLKQLNRAGFLAIVTLAVMKTPYLRKKTYSSIKNLKRSSIKWNLR